MERCVASDPVRENLENWVLPSIEDHLRAEIVELRGKLKACEERQTAEPVAWQRAWDAAGERPQKERNPNGRMAWPTRFKALPVTKAKMFDDDVPLYASPR